MTYLSTVLKSPAVAGAVEVVAAARDRDVSSVVVVDDVQQLGDAPEASIAVLQAQANAHVKGYRLDMAIRLSQSSGVAALVLPAESTGGVPSTSRSLASRADIWLLRADPQISLAPMLVAIDRAIEAQCAEALHRLDQLVEALETRRRDEDEAGFLDRLSRAYGHRLEAGEHAQGSVSASGVLAGSVAGEEVRVAVASGNGRSERIAARLAVTLVAAALARSREQTSRAHSAPVLSAAEVLTELLAIPKGDSASLLRQARTLGIPVDGWHVAVRIEFEDHVEPADASAAVNAFETREAVVRTALDHVRSRSSSWYLGRSRQAFLLVRMYRSDPGRGAIGMVADVAEDLLETLRSSFPGVGVRCGIGGIHSGPMGLTSTAIEARAAVVAGRAAGAVDKLSIFDRAGLRRSLVEWYATDTAGEAVGTVLKPLDSLGPEKRDSFILTLKTFLDYQGSLSETARILHFHRNTVAYRINRIFEMLDVDPDDPDDRLLLQLACRARALG